MLNINNMKLSELFLNRFLCRDNNQDSQTKDSTFVSLDSTGEPAVSIASGGAAQDINTGNVLINGAQLEPGTFPATVLDVANWGWGQTCVFSSTDADTVSWTAGTFTSADGTSYSISAGNTGNMTAKTYIYLSLLDSETVYQTTTTPADSVGLGKVLIAVAENAAVSATYMLSEATQIVGDNIVANSINASKITAGQLIVGTNVGLGTAQDSAGVTTIIGNTVTTSFVNALSVTAGSVAAENITGTTISGKTITGATITGSTLQTGTSGYNINITANEFQMRNNTTVMATWKKIAMGDDAILTTQAATISTINNDLLQGNTGSYVRFGSQYFTPYTDGGSYLGDSTHGWDRIYVGTSGAYMYTSGTDLIWNGTSLSGQNKIPSGGSAQQYLKYASSGVPSWEYLSGTNCGSLIPSSSVVTLGNSTYYWDEAHIGTMCFKTKTSNPSVSQGYMWHFNNGVEGFRGYPSPSWGLIASFDMTAI